MHALIKSFAAGLVAIIAAAPLPAIAQKDPPKRAIDFFDKVEITFTATNIKAIGKAADANQPPADTATGRLLLFIPKVRDEAEGFWETSAVRFASMSIKTGDYSFPMTRTSASIQFIDNRPMRLVIGRAPGGRSGVYPGTQDFALALTRDKRTLNDYQLAFSNFSFTLFGKKDVKFVSDVGKATVKILEQESAKSGNTVGLGFSIGSFKPDERK